MKRRILISLIQKEISDFTVQAYCNGSFQMVTKQDTGEVEHILLLSGGLYFFCDTHCV